MTTAFVAGATGYTGHEVVAALRARDVRTLAHVRPDSPAIASWRQRFEPLGARVDLTAWDEDALAQTLAKHDVTHVFALLGTTRARAKKEGMSGVEAYERVDYGLTSLLLRAAVRSGRTPLFVYLSSTGVTPQTKNPYLAARARMEAELRASGLPFVIARPSFISGPDRDEVRPLERAATVVGDAGLALAGVLGAKRFRERFKSISAKTLAAALVRAAYDEPCAGEILEGDRLQSLA